MEHGVHTISQDLKRTNRVIVCNHFTLVQDDQPVCHGDHIFQPVFTNQDGGSQFPVDAPQGLQKVRCRNGVQLAGWLIQDQHIRLQHHNGCQIQKLFLSAGKLGH